MKGKHTLGFAVGILVMCLMGAAWNGTYELVPAGTDLAADLDIYIQGFKAEVRQRAEVEHFWGGSADDNGLHSMGSARVFDATAAPTDINGGTAALGPYNSAAGTDASTLLTTDEPGATTRDIGAGRLWADSDGTLADADSSTDDNQLFLWDETANTFTRVVKARDPGGAGVGATNLIYNGGFEIRNGFGAAGDPAGWTNLNTATIDYDTTAVSEGVGSALETTAAGGADEGVSQSLSGLKASTAYVFRARARPETAADTCDLQVTGGAATVTDTSAAGTNAFETLEVVATTNATPDPLVVRLEANVDTDICDWDHVEAFEQFASQTAAGSAPCFDSDSTTATDYGAAAMVAVPGLSCAWTPPSPGWFIQVQASVTADNDCGQDVGLEVELLENGTEVAWATSNIGDPDSDVAGDIRDMTTTHLNFVRMAPTPGTTLTYTLRARTENCGNVFSNDEDNDTVTGFTPASTLSVVPMQVR